MPSAPVIRKAHVTQLLHRHLIASAGVTALVDDRIRTEHAQDVDGLEYPLVILDAEIGDSGYQGGVQRWSVDVYVYSARSQSEADAVYDEVYHALHAERLHDPSGVIGAAGSAREIERPRGGYNDQTRSWYARAMWRVVLVG